MKKKHRIGGGGGEEGEYQNNEEFEEVISTYFCILNLPTDLIYKIFCRLQVKFIWRCRVVCKAWYNLLSLSAPAADFMNYYAKNTPFTTVFLYQPQVLNTTSTTKRHTFSFVEISEDGDDCTRTTIEIKLPFLPKPYSFFSIKGSCNGLFCLLHYNHRIEIILIYNPTSGKIIPLPPLRSKPISKRYSISSAYLFGFSPSSNHFKVVSIVHIFDKSGVTKDEQRWKIFTVGVDHEWRQLDDFPFKFQYHVRVVVVDLNGVACWFARNTKIAAFDFGEEKACHISHPPGVVLNYPTMKLVVLNRRLCLLDYSVPSHHTIWTMEEYGVAESWIKSVILIRSCFPSDAPAVHCPIAILRNGNILLWAKNHDLMIYSPKQKECTIVEVLNDVGGLIHYIMEFAPLGSLHCINKL